MSHFTLKPKQQSIAQALEKTQVQGYRSITKTHVHGVLGLKGMLLNDCLPTGEMKKGERYFETLRKLHHAI